MRFPPACLVLPLAASAVLVALPLYAHDIYSRADLYACCHDHDCRVAEPGEVVEQQDGTYLVTPTQERFTSADVKASPDARFHRCLYDKHDVHSRTRCILVPAGS